MGQKSHTWAPLRGQKSLGPLKMSLEKAHKVIVPQNYVLQFLKQRDINSYLVLKCFWSDLSFYPAKKCSSLLHSVLNYNIEDQAFLQSYDLPPCPPCYPPPPSFPPGSCLSLFKYSCVSLVELNLLTGKEGREWTRSQIIWPLESLALYR